jgi:hypothetical protein
MVFVGRGFTSCGKTQILSFRGTRRAEESLILLTLERREIPHFVRNDKIAYFFRSLFSRDINNSKKQKALATEALTNLGKSIYEVASSTGIRRCVCLC